MVIVRITMGLGNQMFQYAAGLSLSKEKNTALKVDTSSYAGYKLRKYELNTFFEIDTPEASKEEVNAVWYNHPVIKFWNKILPNKKIRALGLPYDEKAVQRNLLALFDVFYPSHKRKTYVEPHYHYDKDFFSANDNLYLHGFWMSWKYFEKYDAEIRKAFTVRQELVKHLSSTTNYIESENSVSIHIRRTDYTTPEVIKLKGLLSLDFFRKGVDYIKQKTGKVTVFVFSDDIPWVKENFRLEGVKVIYVDNTVSNSAIEDFYLMMKCRHNVISNSTFSWWAAHLNNNENKIIVAPRQWYAVSRVNSKDVCPASWTLMDM